jgi:clan AA aspartic protease (TIGR02281 family)
MKIKIGTPIIIERVKVEGPKATREVDLILDTGARFTSLSWEILEDIGYDPAISSERVKLITANGVIEAPLVRVKKLSISNLSCKNVEVVCLDVPELAEVDGLLGLSFLTHFRTVIDYKKGFLEII